jgi:hypothetical protein
MGHLFEKSDLLAVMNLIIYSRLEHHSHVFLSSVLGYASLGKLGEPQVIL